MLNAIEMQHPIVFFDGICNLCNFSIDWLIRHDSRAVYKVASLQGEHAKKLLPKELTSTLNSLVLLDANKTYNKSTAVLKIAEKLGTPWRFFSFFLLIPRPLRDFLYDFVASRRYRIFGKRDSCRLPSPDDSARFLN